MAKEKSLFKFYLKATCLLKLCIEGRTNMFYICFDTVFVTHYHMNIYIYQIYCDTCRDVRCDLVLQCNPKKNVSSKVCQ